ncbi:MAG: DUF1003 domain-containing protein [Acidobacteriota bacterium]
MSNKQNANKGDKASGSESLETETQNNVLKVAEIENSQRADRKFAEKLAEIIAAFCGSMVFVYVHIAWFGGWIIVNSFVPRLSFDPFPYTFLTLVVSLEAIFLSTFILISQNHETKLTEQRNHLDLQINMLTEQENTKMLELLQVIARKVGIDANDPQTEALLEPMEPGRIVEQIMSAAEANEKKSK